MTARPLITMALLLAACGGSSPAGSTTGATSAGPQGVSSGRPAEDGCARTVVLAAVHDRNGGDSGVERGTELAREALGSGSGIALVADDGEFLINVMVEMTALDQGARAGVWLHVERASDRALLAVLHTAASANATGEEGRTDALSGALQAAVAQLPGALAELDPGRACPHSQALALR